MVKVPEFKHSYCQEKITMLRVITINGVYTAWCPKCYRYVKNIRPSMMPKPIPKEPETDQKHFYVVTASGRVGKGILMVVLGVSNDSTSEVGRRYKESHPKAIVRHDYQEKSAP